MIVLRQPPRAWGLPSMSPFCAKLETYLRMAKIPYEIKPGNPRVAPKGKIPYIEHDGHVMGDSEHIVEYLREKFGDRLDAHLDPAAKAKARLIRVMLESHTYFAIGSTLRSSRIANDVRERGRVALRSPALEAAVAPPGTAFR